MDTRLIERHGEFLGAFASELSTVIGSLLDVPAAVLPVELPPGPVWSVRVKLAGALRGTVTVAFETEGAGLVAARLMGLDDEAPAEAVADTLNEITAQAASALSQQPLGLGTSFSVEGAPSTSRPLPDGEPSSFELTFGDAVAHLSCWTDLVPADNHSDSAPASHATPAAEAAASRESPPPALGVEPVVSARVPQVSANRPDNLDMILDVELPITVRFGHTEMSLQALAALGPGSIIELGRSPDDAVDLLINGKPIARGEVVVVAGNYGVRVIEVTSAVERIRTMGA